MVYQIQRNGQFYRKLILYKYRNGNMILQEMT
jgi:hypothetical protein